MSFHFNLQKVLDYREQLEEEAKVRLGKAEHELANAEKKLDSLKQEYASAQEASSGKIMKSDERWLHDQFIKGLKADINEAGLQVRMCAQMAEEARKLLTARSLDKKLLEKLKNRKRNNYLKEEQKQEQNFNDEIATIRYKATSF